MTGEEVTLWAAIIGALSGILGIVLQVRSNRRIATLDHESKAHGRLLTAQLDLQKLTDPTVHEVPFMIKQEDEFTFLKTNLNRFCEVARKHALAVEPLLDTLDTDIRRVVERYVVDFRHADVAYQRLVNEYEKDPDPDWLLSRQEDLRETACYCHVLCNAVRTGVRVQIDRFSQKLLSRRRYMNDDIHYDFDNVFYIEPRVRRVFDPEWRDWP